MLISNEKKKQYMRLAFIEAEKAFDKDEVPVGAVITYKEQVIAKAHNQIRTLKDPTAHAEMIAITQAASFLQNERLNDCDLYVTLEPCAMCVGASVLGRIRSINFAASDPKTGACGSVLDLSDGSLLNHKICIQAGLMQEEASYLLTSFFKNKRK